MQNTLEIRKEVREDSPELTWIEEHNKMGMEDCRLNIHNA